MNNPTEGYKNKHVLVTGGAGFIGSHLVEALLGSGAQVTVVDKNVHLTRRRRNALPAATWFEDDLCNWLGVGGEIDSLELIFHLAGNESVKRSLVDPHLDLEENLLPTFSLLESLRKLSNPPRLINVSSSAVYGNPLRLPIRETDPTVPISAMGVSKLAAERYVDVYNLLYRIPAVNLRVFSVYGPGGGPSWLIDLLKGLKERVEYLTFEGDSSDISDLIYISDVVKALMLVGISAPARGEVYNLGYGLSITAEDFIDLLRKNLGVNLQVNFSGKRRQGAPKNLEVDMHRLWGLGYSAEIKLEEGLPHFLDWFTASG
jgi:UDP-glucose 4-epimerase